MSILKIILPMFMLTFLHANEDLAEQVSGGASGSQEIAPNSEPTTERDPAPMVHPLITLFKTEIKNAKDELQKTDDEELKAQLQGKIDKFNKHIQELRVSGRVVHQNLSGSESPILEDEESRANRIAELEEQLRIALEQEQNSQLNNHFQLNNQVSFWGSPDSGTMIVILGRASSDQPNVEDGTRLQDVAPSPVSESRLDISPTTRRAMEEEEERRRLRSNRDEAENMRLFDEEFARELLNPNGRSEASIRSEVFRRYLDRIPTDVPGNEEVVEVNENPLDQNRVALREAELRSRTADLDQQLAEARAQLAARPRIVRFSENIVNVALQNRLRTGVFYISAIYLMSQNDLLYKWCITPYWIVAVYSGLSIPVLCAYYQTTTRIQSTPERIWYTLGMVNLFT